MRSLRFAVIAAVGLILFIPSNAFAASLTVNDDEPGYEPAGLAISSVKFTNGSSKIQVTARFSDLRDGAVDEFRLSVETKRKRANYFASYRPGQRPTFEVLTSSGIRQKKCSARWKVSYPKQTVQISIPQSCLSKAVRGKLRFNFGAISENADGYVVDNAPTADVQTGEYGLTRWIKRG